MGKVIDIEDRIPTLRAKRKKRTNRKFMTLILLFFIILLILVYFQSPYSKVQKINVTGGKLAEQQYYSKKSTIRIGDSIWGFLENDIEKVLESDHWVKNASVSRKLLTTVNIKVEEWSKVAYTEEKGVFYPILENGEVYKKETKDYVLNAPILIGFTDKKIQKRLVKELARLNPEVLALISQINMHATEGDPYSIRLFMNDGFEVRAIIPTFVDKLNYYPSIVSQIPKNQEGVIDLEVGSFYKPFDEEYMEDEQNEKTSNVTE